MNRRGFLRSAAWVPALAAGFVPRPSFAADGPNCKFPLSPRERLAVASYPFRKDFNLKNGPHKLLEFPAMVVKRFGVHGIEPLDEHFPSTEPAYLDQLRTALKEANAHVVNIPVGVLHGSFYDPDSVKSQTAIASAKKWIDVAAQIASPSIRVHVQAVQGVTPDVPRAAEALEQVAAYGREKNVIVNLENDDPASEDAPFIVSIIQRAKTPWLRALPDFCNTMLLNKGDEYNYRSVEAMFREACNISHVKEIETDEGKVYRVDAAKTFAIAKRTGYRGYFSIEWDSDGDPFTGTQHLIDLSLQSLG